MRIAILTLDFAPAVGGVQQYLLEAARGLGRHHEVTVITPCGGELDCAGFARMVVPSAGPLAFARALASLRPERVLVGHAHPRLLLPAALLAPGRYATVAHGNDYLAAQRCWHRPLYNRLLAGSRPLIAQSVANADRLQRLGLPRPVVVRPGTDPARFRPRTGAPAPAPALLTVGRLVPRKGIDLVLAALPRLLATTPTLHYRIVGDGPDRARLEALARELDVAGAVEFVGRVADADLPDAYRNADVFVMPAREDVGAASLEGFGIVYLEASASGLPVIAARSGGAGEAVRDGVTGLLVAPDDVDGLAQALQRLIADAGLRLRLGLAGRAWVEEEMNWERAVRQLDACLEG